MLTEVFPVQPDTHKIVRVKTTFLERLQRLFRMRKERASHRRGTHPVAVKKRPGHLLVIALTDTEHQRHRQTFGISLPLPHRSVGLQRTLLVCVPIPYAWNPDRDAFPLQTHRTRITAPSHVTTGMPFVSAPTRPAEPRRARSPRLPLLTRPTTSAGVLWPATSPSWRLHGSHGRPSLTHRTLLESMQQIGMVASYRGVRVVVV